MPADLPVGKLPPDLLAYLLGLVPVRDARVRQGPGIGLDCAIIEMGDRLLALKTDPITFATDAIGWYAVQVNANDIATSGAEPRWLLATLLLPARSASRDLVEQIFRQLGQACQEIGISLVGGHTEVTYGLDRPILAGTMIGEVARDDLITPAGARPGDQILLTKSVPIEATALLGRELADQLLPALGPDSLAIAQQFLYRPGIGVMTDARLARQAGRVTAMHDPTEGGILTALWELAEASQVTLLVDLGAIPVLPLSAQICRTLGIDPLGAIASGALLLTAAPEGVEAIIARLAAGGIACSVIGQVEAGLAQAVQEINGRRTFIPRPARDEIARLFER